MQNAIGVGDAISAENIGQFPDAPIGAALSRVPGVTVDRGSVNLQPAAGAATSTGNVTGVTNVGGELGGKRLGLLHELIPAANRFALLVQPNTNFAQSTIENTKAAATTIDVCRPP